LRYGTKYSIASKNVHSEWKTALLSSLIQEVIPLKMSITTLEELSVSFDAVCEHAGVCP
jgi:hypothetical protein